MAKQYDCEHFVDKGYTCVHCDLPNAVVWPCLRCNPNGGTWHLENKCLSCGNEITNL